MSDPGRPRTGPLVVVLACAAALVIGTHLWLTIARPDRAIFSFDSAEYALAARELLRTGVLATPFAYLALLPAGAHPPYPLVAGNPMLPLLQVPAFALFGVHAWVSLVPAVILYVVVVVLVGLLALEATGSVALAVVAGVALALQPQVLLVTADPLSEMVFSAPWTAALLLLVRGARRPRPLAVGALLGLAHLARPVLLPMIPAWLVGVALQAPRGKRLQHLARFAAGFAPFLVGLSAYYVATTGSPWSRAGGLMVLTGLGPGFGEHDVARQISPPAPLAWIRAHPQAFWEKLVRGSAAMLPRMLGLGGRVIGILFLVHLVRPGLDGRARFVLAFSVVALTALAVLTLPWALYLLPLVPVAVALGLAEAWRLARAARAPAWLAVALAAVLGAWYCARPTIAAWQAATASDRPVGRRLQEREMVAFGRALAARVPAGTIVCSDMAPWIAWYADRTSLVLPMSLAALDTARARWQVGAIVLTNEWDDHTRAAEPWPAVWEGRAPLPGWACHDTLVAGQLRALVLLPEASRDRDAR